MKLKLILSKQWFAIIACLFTCTISVQLTVTAQDSTAAAEAPAAPAKIKPVKNTFESVWIIDNQTVMVPVKGTFEMDIMHRFGKVEKGYEDLAGFFAPSNIRLGVNYAPINKLYVGLGLTKEHMLWDVNAKYAIITQTPGKYPVSISYYANAAYDSRRDPDGSLFKYREQRLSFFNQVIIARKISKKLSVQIAPSLSHQNAVNGYYTKNDSTGQEIFKEMKHEHFAIAFSARYKLTAVTSLTVNYDQPITKHPTNNPNPNLSLGLDFNTSNHSFQLFLGNYFSLSPQQNNLFNNSDPFSHNKTNSKSDFNFHFLDNFRIGFNITRLWNY
jgi:hypothetical protein